MDGGQGVSVKTLTVERVKQLLSYDPVTGIFTWLVSMRRVHAGDVAGTVSHGYVVIKIDGRKYRAHRLAWFLMTGAWPEGDLDHEDTNRKNNAWSNLRPADKVQNAQNMKRMKRNKTGFKGVGWHKDSKRFRATIRIDGKNLHLGMFKTAEEAYDVYCYTAKKYFGEYARLE